MSSWLLKKILISGSTRWFLLLILVILLPALYGFPAFSLIPTAADDSVELMEDSVKTISVLDNDLGVASDPANRELTIVEGPEHGDAEPENNTTVQYTPDKDFFGRDSFVYRIENTAGGHDQATVTIEVRPVNDPPIPRDGVLTTSLNTSVTITLSATDKDIDPMRPDRHHLEFKLLGEPLHGEITGDIEDVQYEAPHKAFVELEYTPEPGFRGVETINYEVIDEDGVLNISVIEIDVISAEKPPITFGGYWKVDGTVESDEPDFLSDFGTDLTTVYRYADVELRADAGWSEDALDSLRLKGELPLGIFEIDSTVDFDPDDDPPFDYWRTRTDFDFSEIDFRHTFYLDEDSEDTYHWFEGRWSLGDVTFRNRTKFTGADPHFDENRLRTRWKWTDCDLTLNTDLTISDEGFEEFAVDVGDIPLFYGIYFEFETTFTPTSKEVEPNIFYRSEWLDCFKILGEVETNDLENTLEGFNIYGIRFRHTFPNGLYMRIDTSVDQDRNASVTGDSEFSNKFTLSGPFYAGSRVPGRIQLMNYLGSEENNELFGWGKSRLKVIAPLGREFDLKTDLTVSADSPILELTLGAEIFW